MCNYEHAVVMNQVDFLSNCIKNIFYNFCPHKIITRATANHLVQLRRLAV